jgi:hypothetical protein
MHKELRLRYDRRYIQGSILSLVKANHVDSDSSKPRRQLYGYSVSSKRYVIYEKTTNDIKVVEPKAHGLGYLAAPREEKEGEEGNWIAEAWDWLLRCELGLECTAPRWLDIPAMMPIVISTPNILQRLEPRPFSFLLIPQVDSQGGLPANVDGSHFTLVTSYTSNRSDWLNSECVNIDGDPCTCETRGLLQRCAVIAASRRYLGKETDRRWEQGEDMSLVEFKAVEYQGSKQVVASDEIKEQILKTGIRKLERETRVSHHTINRILKGEQVRHSTLTKITKRLHVENDASA